MQKGLCVDINVGPKKEVIPVAEVLSITQITVAELVEGILRPVAVSPPTGEKYVGKLTAGEAFFVGVEAYNSSTKIVRGDVFLTANEEEVKDSRKEFNFPAAKHQQFAMKIILPAGKYHLCANVTQK